MTARSARDRLEEALARIADPKGEGARACLTVYAKRARAEADAADARAWAGVTLGPLDGAIIGIKDLFDVAGEPTRAGSKVLAKAPPADADAPVVRRLRAAGGTTMAGTGNARGRPADRSASPAPRRCVEMGDGASGGQSTEFFTLLQTSRSPGSPGQSPAHDRSKLAPQLAPKCQAAARRNENCNKQRLGSA
jgi:hypothetical protein